MSLAMLAVLKRDDSFENVSRVNADCSGITRKDVNHSTVSASADIDVLKLALVVNGRDEALITRTTTEMLNTMLLNNLSLEIKKVVIARPLRIQQRSLSMHCYWKNHGKLLSGTCFPCTFFSLCSLHQLVSMLLINWCVQLQRVIEGRGVSWTS